MDDHWTPTSLPRSQASLPSDFTPHPSSPYIPGPNDSITPPSPWHAPSQPKGPVKPSGPHANKGCLIGGGVGALLLIALIFFVLLPALGSTTHHITAATVTPTTQSYPATVTPAPGATVTPTVGPGTPTATPIVVYIPGKPAPTLAPYPTYTLRPGQPTYTPQPTWTTPPAPTATATPHPVLTLDDSMDGTGTEFATSGDLNVNPIGPDSTTENRGTWSQDWIVWQTANIQSFTVVAYYCTGQADPSNCDPNHPKLTIVPMLIEESNDDANWCTPGQSRSDYVDTVNHPAWTQVTWTSDGGACTSGAQFLRVMWVNTDQSYPVWSPALGNVTIHYQP